MRALLIAAMAAMAVACGSTRPAPPSSTPPTATDAGPRAASPGVPDPAPNRPLTEAECAAVVDRMIDLNLTERRARGDEAVPDPEDVERIRAETRAEFVPACREQLSRAVYACVMAATSMDALRDCGA